VMPKAMEEAFIICRTTDGELVRTPARAMTTDELKPGYDQRPRQCDHPVARGQRWSSHWPLSRLQHVAFPGRPARHQSLQATIGSATSLWLPEIAPSAYVAALPPPPFVKYRHLSDHPLCRTVGSQLHAAGSARHFSAPARRDAMQRQHNPQDPERRNLRGCK